MEKVDIITKYKPNLIDARRIETQPELKEPEVKEIKLDYNFPDLRYKVEPAITPISPLRYKATRPTFVKGNFIKAGFGNYTTPLLHIDLHNGLNRNYAYGLSAFHLSSTGQPKFKSIIDDRIELRGAKFMNGKTLCANIGYSRQGYNYYGFNHNENSFRGDSVKQVLNNVSGNIHYDNKNSYKKVKTVFDADIYRFSTVEQNELGYRLSGSINAKAGPGDFGIYAAFEGFASGPDSVKYNRQYLDLNPVYKMKYQNFLLTIGANSTVFFDSLKNEFYLYPNFKADYYVVPEKMKAYVGIGGGLNKGSTKNLYTENPFLAENQIIRNQNKSYSIYGGVAGKLNNKFDYYLELSQQFIYDLALFATDTFPLQKFKVLYDDVNLFMFKIGVNYKRFEKVNIGTQFVYYAYDGEATHAYQRPNFEWNTGISAEVIKKLNLRGKFYLIGTRYALVEGAIESVKLKPIADLNLGADYQYKKNLSFFLDVNNLTNQTYQRWFNYPSYGLNGIVGFTFSF